MNQAAVAEFLRRNWYFVIIIVACIVAPFLFRGSAEPVEPQPKPTPRPSPIAPQPLEPSGPQPTRDTVRTQTAIDEHRTYLEANPKAEDAPARRFAMGNLYQKLGKYEEAAQCFEQVLYESPDWPGCRNVYLALASCYEQVRDETNARRTYQRMLDFFPQDSQEYKYAQAWLAGQVP